MSDSPLDQNGFIGVDPVYQNFANEYDNPVQSGDESVEEADESDKDESKELKLPKGKLSSQG